MTVKKLTRVETLFLIDHATRMFYLGTPYKYISNDECASRDVIRFLVPILRGGNEPISQSSAWERLSQVEKGREAGNKDIKISETRSNPEGQKILVYELTKEGQDYLNAHLSYLKSVYPKAVETLMSRVEVEIERP